MEFTPVKFQLKDGREAVLRSVCESDAAEMLAVMIRISAETDFIVPTPDEWAGFTVEKEAALLKANQENPDVLMLVCLVEGRIAGVSSISFKRRAKTGHRAGVGISLLRDYWGQGIGTAMFEQMLACARKRPEVQQVELEFIEGNSRGRGLYEKMGFRVVGMRPDAFRMKDGSLRNEYIMMLKL